MVSRGGERGGRAGRNVSVGCFVFFTRRWFSFKMYEINHETKLKE